MVYQESDGNGTSTTSTLLASQEFLLGYRFELVPKGRMKFLTVGKSFGYSLHRQIVGTVVQQNRFNPASSFFKTFDEFRSFVVYLVTSLFVTEPP